MPAWSNLCDCAKQFQFGLGLFSGVIIRVVRDLIIYTYFNLNLIAIVILLELELKQTYNPFFMKIEGPIFYRKNLWG